MPLDPLTLLTLLAIGLFAGIASGFVGVGGGLILVPAMMAFLGLGQHAAQGTSLAMMLPPWASSPSCSTTGPARCIGPLRQSCA